MLWELSSLFFKIFTLCLTGVMRIPCEKKLFSPISYGSRLIVVELWTCEQRLESNKQSANVCTRFTAYLMTMGRNRYEGEDNSELVRNLTLLEWGRAIDMSD